MRFLALGSLASALRWYTRFSMDTTLGSSPPSTAHAKYLRQSAARRVEWSGSS